MVKMSRHQIFLFSLVLLFSLGGLLYLLSWQRKNTESRTEKAPNFVLHQLKGGEVELSDFIGKVVVLRFTASW